MSELPAFYAETTQDGARVERASDEQSPDTEDVAPLVSTMPARKPSLRSQGPARRNTRRDDYQSEPTLDRRPSRRRPKHDFSRPRPKRPNYARDDPRYDEYDLDADDDYEDDFEEEYERPYRPARRSRPVRPDEFQWEDRQHPARFSRDYYNDVERRDFHKVTPARISYDSRRPGEDTRLRMSKDLSPIHPAYAFDSTVPFDRAPTVEKGAPYTLDIKKLTKEERREVMRLPWLQWMNSDTKNHFVAGLGEFVGTTMFLYFAFAGTQVANIPSGDSAGNTTTNSQTGFNVSTLLYIALVFGFSLMVNVWVFFRISGGLFNPAVTLAMVLTSTIPPVRAVILLIAQIAGGIAASALVLVMFPTPLNVRTTLGAGTSIVQGLFIEAVLTFELVFTIFMLAKEKHRATFIAPVGIGLALFSAELVGVYYTGGSLNPARSFGPCVVTNDYNKEHWIYWVGPFIGSLFAVVFYKFIKVLEYEVANPGQDADENENENGKAKHLSGITSVKEA